MTSDCHRSPEDTLLDAARDSILAVGWKRTTLTDVARRAGVSRMTIYRSWSDMQSLLADLMTREWAGLVPAVTAGSAGSAAGSAGSAAERLGRTVSGTVRAMRGNDLFRKILEVDPELLLPYLLDRRGRSQDAVLALLEAGIAEGQQDGSVRSGQPRLLARAVALAAHGFALSAPTMAEDGGPAVDDLDAALQDLVRRYLAS